MIRFPTAMDLVDALRQCIRREDYADRKNMEKALQLIGACLSHPAPEREELAALRHYFSDASLTLSDARLRLVETIRNDPLPEGPEAIKFHDLLLQITVPYLRLFNAKYIAQRQKEKRGSESAI